MGYCFKFKGVEGECGSAGKALATQPDELSSVPGTHTTEKNRFPEFVPHAHTK